MDKNNLFKNLSAAFFAQGVAFVCSAVMSLVVPKILGITEYGYYQLFIFYSSYVSFFALGLNDGVYLEHGGKSRNNIDKSLIKSEFVVGLCYQLCIALAIVLFALFFGDGPERTFVICADAIFLIISNATTYLGYVFQAMNETRKFSYGTVIDRSVFLIPLALCVIFRVTHFQVYVVFFILARTIAFGYSLWNAREFLRFRLLPVSESVRYALGSMRIGIVLTFANVSFMLIMGFARFMIDTLWGIEAFGKLSFSLSLVNFALTFISQASMVLFPAFRQSDSNSLRRYYHLLRSGLCSLLPFAYLLYFPLRFLASIWIPQYGSSLDYLIYLMPICIFGVQNNLVYNTFYKVLNEPHKLLSVNVKALFIAVIGVIFACFIVQNTIAVVLFAIIGIASCLVMSDRYLSQRFNESNMVLPLGSLAVTVCFIAINAFLPFGLAAFFSCVLLGVFGWFYRKTLLEIVSRTFPKTGRHG